MVNTSHLVIFLGESLEHVISTSCVIERAVDRFVNSAPSEISLIGHGLLVLAVVNVQNAISYELLRVLERLRAVER